MLERRIGWSAAACVSNDRRASPHQRQASTGVRARARRPDSALRGRAELIAAVSFLDWMSVRCFLCIRRSGAECRNHDQTTRGLGGRSRPRPKRAV